MLIEHRKIRPKEILYSYFETSRTISVFVILYSTYGIECYLNDKQQSVQVLVT